eukprot:GEMP01065475.1.p2 GENE.GEMP01065475.1~~GEMP01065475.1.p2  ORF type:complete len:182 (+),score=46.46 GEMP01065475.1:259-804(+)
MDAKENENTPPANGHAFDNAKQEPQRNPPTPQQCGLPPRYVSGVQRIEGSRGAATPYSGTSCTSNFSDAYGMVQILGPGQVHPKRPSGGPEMYQPQHHELQLQWQQQECAIPRPYQNQQQQYHQQKQQQLQMQQRRQRQPQRLFLLRDIPDPMCLPVRPKEVYITNDVEHDYPTKTRDNCL